MASLEIRVFGSLRLQDRETGTVRPLNGKVRDLFSYLLVAREATHSREQLAGLFWGDRDGEKARHCLNTTLWRLNRLLASAGANNHLRIGAYTIGFNAASDCWIDVVEFETRCGWAEATGNMAAEQKALLYSQAVAFYDGDLLTDCYEDWCVIERERLRCLYSRALKWLITYYISRKDYAPAIEYARRALVCDPLYEEVHRQLMQMYLAMGQPTAALRQYRTCEEIVRRELAQEPMPETQAFLGQILGLTPSLAPSDSARTRSPRPEPAMRYERASADALAAAATQLCNAAEALQISHGQLRRVSVLLQETIRDVSSTLAALEDTMIWKQCSAQLSRASDTLAVIAESLDGAPRTVGAPSPIRLVQ
ncbi:MAG TPA: BTAD domain-containing putative transcriptional regulator [Gemmatimonadaceae bacterium]